MNKLIITTDGGSRSNPGPAAAAFVVWSGEEVIFERGFYLGIATNNQAEYKAVLASLRWLAGLTDRPATVTWQMDSLLVVEQLQGHWKVKDYKLRVLRDTCLELLKEIFPAGGYEFVHVRREFNSAADALVNQTLDAHLNKN